MNGQLPPLTLPTTTVHSTFITNVAFSTVNNLPLVNLAETLVHRQIGQNNQALCSALEAAHVPIASGPEFLNVVGGQPLNSETFETQQNEQNALAKVPDERMETETLSKKRIRTRSVNSNDSFEVLGDSKRPRKQK